MSQPQRIEAVEAAPPPRRDTAIDATITVLDVVFGAPFERTYDIRLWDETALRGTANPQADFSLHIRRRGALRRMLLPPSELSIVEAFISNDIDIDGNVESAMGLADAIGKRLQSLATTIHRHSVRPATRARFGCSRPGRGRALSPRSSSTTTSATTSTRSGWIRA